MTVAVDSPETIEAAADAGIAEVLIDVNVGLPRCGCPPEHAGMLGDRARRSGMQVRGVMGYEGHVVGIPDREQREQGCRDSMDLLATAHQAVGGDVISAGGTGTFDCNGLATEIQAGSYALMDTAYGKLRNAVSPGAVHRVDDHLGFVRLRGGGLWAEGAWAWTTVRLTSTGEASGSVPMSTSPLRLIALLSRGRSGEDCSRARGSHGRVPREASTWYREAEIVETWEIDLRGW